jgi:hypothetical protein
MKIERWLFMLTGLNLVLLVALLAQWQPASAQSTAPVLRGRALEIVDDQGRVRASVTISSPDSRGTYPENVVLRLHDRSGKPTIKLETHEAGGGYAKGSGLGLLGDSDATQAFIGTDGSIGKVELKNRDGQRQRLKP